MASRQAAVGPETLRLQGIPIFWPYDRYAALMDRVEGKDANTLVQSYSDILPGRPTAIEHRHPHDDLRQPYERTTAAFLTKLHALTIMAGEHQTHDYYMTIGPMFADPL